MMMVPSILKDNLFDSFFNDDFFWPEMSRGTDRTSRKLYGHRVNEIMRTDVKETEKGFEVAIDLPGFKKEDVTCELKDGYLTVSAAKGLDKDENDKKGKLIRQERYAGAMQRSFYVGEELTEEDVKASFKHGVLSLSIPKKEAKAVPEKKTIMIEG
jgi:HSP20 family molecular chaperone IbpA